MWRRSFLGLLLQKGHRSGKTSTPDPISSMPFTFITEPFTNISNGELVVQNRPVHIMFVCRNGIILLEGPDYTIVNKTIKITTNQGWVVTDTFQVSYYY